MIAMNHAASVLTKSTAKRGSRAREMGRGVPERGASRGQPQGRPTRAERDLLV